MRLSVALHPKYLPHWKDLDSIQALRKTKTPPASRFSTATPTTTARSTGDPGRQRLVIKWSTPHCAITFSPTCSARLRSEIYANSIPSGTRDDCGCIVGVDKVSLSSDLMFMQGLQELAQSELLPSALLSSSLWLSSQASLRQGFLFSTA